MAELYLPPDILSVVQPFQHSLSGETWSVTYGLEYDGVTDPAAIINGVFAETKSNLAVLIDNNLSFLPTQAYYRLVDGGPLFQVIATGAVANGSDANAKAPPNVCVSIKKRTAQVGRRYRGRMFLPGVVDETLVDEVGNILPAGITSINTQIALWEADVLAVAGVEKFVLMHAPWENDPVDLTPTPTPITSFDCAPVVVTQRRRLP